MDFLRVVAGEGKDGAAIHVRGEEWVGLRLAGNCLPCLRWVGWVDGSLSSAYYGR